MLAYSLFNATTGRRLATVTLTWRQRACIHTDGDGTLYAGDLPRHVGGPLIAGGLSPLARVALVRTLRPREESSRA